MKNLFNIGKNKVKSSKGAVTLLVAVTIFTFVVILSGTYLTIMLLRRSQYDSNIRIKQVYETDVDRVDEIYNEQISKVGLNLAQKVSIGDYVAYDATNNYSYTSPAGTGEVHGSGYTGTETKDENENEIGQKFTSSSNIKWRVLSKNNETGEVVLISEEPIKTDSGNDYFLSNEVGYLYAEEELNKICAIYGHGKGANDEMTLNQLREKGFEYQTGDEIDGYDTSYIVASGARSIEVEDINKICGVNNISEIDGSYGTKPYTHTLFYPTKTIIDGKSTNAASRSETYTGYWYTGLSKLENTDTLYKILFRNKDDTSNISYWLGSRCMYVGQNNTTFDVRVIVEWSNTMMMGSYSMCNGQSSGLDEYSWSSNERPTCAVRPIVYLKPNILTTGQNSDGVWILK